MKNDREGLGKKAEKKHACKDKAKELKSCQGRKAKKNYVPTEKKILCLNFVVVLFVWFFSGTHSHADASSFKAEPFIFSRIQLTKKYIPRC